MPERNASSGSTRCCASALANVNVAAALGLGSVRLRVRKRRAPEDAAPGGSTTQSIGGIERVPRLVAQDPHAPLLGTALDLEHLPPLELHEARMRQIEGNGHPGKNVRGKEFSR